MGDERLRLAVALRALRCPRSDQPPVAGDEERFRDLKGRPVTEEEVIALALGIEAETREQIVSKRPDA